MKCRICGANIKDRIFSLGYQPISNEYYDMCSPYEVHYPLDLYFCNDCKFLQMDEVVQAVNIFVDDYAYVSSCSSSWLEHCSQYADYMIDRFELNNTNDLIVELASNDGYLLKFFKEKGYNVFGIEPARGVAEIAMKNGIDTDVAFFNKEYGESWNRKKAKLVIANNVIAHNPNVMSFVSGVRNILDDGGIFTIEFPHLLNLINGLQFDTIYHEHYSYFSLYSMIRLLDRCGLEVFDVQKLPTHGGSLRVFAQLDLQKSAYAINDDAIKEILISELDAGIHYESRYKTFYDDISRIKEETVSFLIEQKRDGKRVVAYGAPAKGNTFLNYCGIGNDLIDYTVDRSSFKVGKVLPGSRIPIIQVDELLNDSPDFVFILPWNIKDEIKATLSSLNTQFVTAIPRLEVS